VNEPIEGLLDSETALRREVDVLAERFPRLPRQDLEREVRATYAELESHASVHAHLLAVTRAKVTEDLRQRGEEIHVRTDDQAG
jgi:hypothetical protein